MGAKQSSTFMQEKLDPFIAYMSETCNAAFYGVQKIILFHSYVIYLKTFGPDEERQAATPLRT